MKKDLDIPHSAAELLAPWRGAQRDTAAANTAAEVATLALEAANAADEAAAETEVAAMAAADSVPVTEHSRIVVRGLSPSSAERLQGDVAIADLGLTERARLRHPAARWWWGVRKGPGAGGAYCYLCDAFIVSWDTRWAMPLRARWEVLRHRDEAHRPATTRTEQALLAASSGKRAAAHAARAAQILLVSAEGGKARANHDVEEAQEAEEAAGKRFHTAEQRGFPRDSA